MQALKFLRMTAVTGLVVISLIVSYQYAASTAARWDPNKPFNNSVDRWEKRIIEVKDLLPEDVTTLGYAADWDLPGNQYVLVDQDAEYMMTQYILAPIRVKPGLDQEWIVGNFTVPGYEAWLDEQLQSYEIADLGFGIFLIHRTTP